MRIKRLLLGLMCLGIEKANASESWSSIGSSITGFGKSIWSGMKAMGEGFIGKIPSGYYYDFCVFNGSNASVSVSIDKDKNIMGARFSTGGGDSTIMNPGTDSGTTFTNESLYFSINMSANGAGIFSEDHYTLGQRHDKTIYMYHAFNDKDTAAVSAEVIGGGYTGSQGFSGRIENKLQQTVAVTFVITNSLNSADVRSMTISDIDAPVTLTAADGTQQNLSSFTYFMPPVGYVMRPSTLQFSPGGSVLVATNGLAQTTGPKTSTPCTYNYVINTISGTPLAYETGMGPGAFDQPQNGGQLRDISPIICQINNQDASNTEPIGTLLPYDITWESLWYVYTGYGWSAQANNGAGEIIQYPMGQIPKGTCADCMIIRPSLAQQTATGPGRFFIVRLNIPETPSKATTAQAKTFLTNLAKGSVQIWGLSTAPQGGAILRKNSTEVPYFPVGMGYPQRTAFNPSDSCVTYPPFSETQLGGTVSLGNLTPFQKSQLLGTVLPTNVGILYDPDSNVEAVLMGSDLFYSYGMGAGPYYYSVCPPYIDVSQMLGSLMNYVSICCYTALTSPILSKIQSVLAETVIGWVTAFYGNALQVEESMATLLVLIGQGKTNEILNHFGTSQSTSYTIPNAVNLLSPQGSALLKMFMYGPCSMTQVPVYYKTGSMSFVQNPGWPAPTVSL